MDKCHTVFQYHKTMTHASAKNKLPRLQRVGKAALPSFHLTARDMDIVQAVYTYRALATPHIDALFFSGQYAPEQRSRVSSRCLHRLKLLFHAGFVRRKEQAQTLSDGRKPLVYFLDRRGAQYLADREGCALADLDWDRQGHEVGSLFLDHLLMSNAMRIAVTCAARQYGYTLTDWREERLLRHDHHGEYIVLPPADGKPQQVTLIPDGFFSLATQKATYHQFLEVDCATSTLQVRQAGKRDWARKVAAYLAYYRSGAYEERYHTKSLRILTVTTSQKRLKHLKDVTEAAGGKARFWFTTADTITSDAILTQPLWHVASREGLFSLV